MKRSKCFRGHIIGALVAALLLVAFVVFFRPFARISPEQAEKLLGASKEQVRHELGDPIFLCAVMVDVSGYEDVLPDSQTEELLTKTVLGEFHYRNGVVYLNGYDRVIAVPVIGQPMFHADGDISFNWPSCSGETGAVGSQEKTT